MEKRPIGASRLPTVRITGDSSESPPSLRGTRVRIVLGRYRLRRRLGSGAFGTVWLARDERLDRDVAVKIVPRERISEGRFEREARAAAQLSHPGIVTLYEAAIDDEGAYLVSELVRGDTLAVALEDGRLSDRDIVRIGIALCDALAHAHAHGVVHRDIKPSNVLLPDSPDERRRAGQAHRLRGRPPDRRRPPDAHRRRRRHCGVHGARAGGGQGRGRGGRPLLAGFGAVRGAHRRQPGRDRGRPASARGVWPCTCPRCAASVATFPASSVRASIWRCVLARASGAQSPSSARALSVSLIQVGDAPGVVASPWPKRTRPLRSRDPAARRVPVARPAWSSGDRLSIGPARDRDRPTSEPRASSARRTMAGPRRRGGRDRDPGRVAGIARPRAVGAGPRGRGRRCRAGGGGAAPPGLGRARAARRRHPGGSGPARAGRSCCCARDCYPCCCCLAARRRGRCRRPPPRWARSASPAPGRRSRRGPSVPGAARRWRSPAGSGWRSPRRWRTPICTRAGRRRRPPHRPGCRLCSRPSITSWRRLRAPNGRLRPGLGGRRGGASAAGGSGADCRSRWCWSRCGRRLLSLRSLHSSVSTTLAALECLPPRCSAQSPARSSRLRRRPSEAGVVAIEPCHPRSMDRRLAAQP